MINIYPSAEQIWAFRELIYKNSFADNSLNTSEESVVSEVFELLEDINQKTNKLVNLLETICDESTTNQLREELDPFKRKGPIFMNAGHFSEYGSNRLHEHLQDSLNHLQNLQMSDPDLYQELSVEVNEKLQHFLHKLTEKLDISSTINISNQTD
jgi:hypothetical protein